jgi:hypothetical protein
MALKTIKNPVRAITARLEARRVLAAAIEAATPGNELSEEQIELLVATVSTPSNARYGRKEAAVQALIQARLPASARIRAAEALCRQARVDGAGADAFGRIVRAGGNSVAIAAVLGLVVVGFRPNSPYDFLFCFLVPWFVIWCLVFPLLLLGEGNRFRSMRTLATRALGALKVESTVPTIIKNAEWRNEPGPTAMAALPGILDAVLKGEIALVPGGVGPLCSFLSSKDDAFVIQILEVLLKYGDGSTARPVERLMRRERSESVLAIAADVLPVLQERLRLEQDPKVLLRPAGETTSDGLLRPVQGAPDAGAETLLRPTEDYEGQMGNVTAKIEE